MAGEGLLDRWARRPARVLARSDRLLLTAERRSDWRALAAQLADEEMLGWQGWPPEVKDARLLAARRGLQPRYMGSPANLAVRDPATRRHLGSYSYSWRGLDFTATTVTLGWWLAKEARGQGLGTESLRLTLRWMAEDTPIETVQIGTRSDNERALRQLAAVNAEFVEERPTPLPDGSEPPGKWFVVRLRP